MTGTCAEATNRLYPAPSVTPVMTYSAMRPAINLRTAQLILLWMCCALLLWWTLGSAYFLDRAAEFARMLFGAA